MGLEILFQELQNFVKMLILHFQITLQIMKKKSLSNLITTF